MFWYRLWRERFNISNGIDLLEFTLSPWANVGAFLIIYDSGIKRRSKVVLGFHLNDEIPHSLTISVA